MTSSLPPLVQATSGALGSALANLLTYPLDLVATRAQTAPTPAHRRALRILKHALRTEGLAGLYAGLAPDTASTLLSNFLYFYFHTFIHALLARRRSSGAQRTSLSETLRKALVSPTPPVLLGVPAELAVGFVAGLASRAISTPLSMIAVRLQSAQADEDDEADPIEKDEGTSTREVETTREGRRGVTLGDIVRDIYAADGLGGFWAGFPAAIPLALTPALTLLLYKLLHFSFLLRSPSHPSPAQASTLSAAHAFLRGAVARSLALAVLYPLVLAKVRVQAGATHVADAWARALRTEGVPGLYAGMGVMLLKGFLSEGVGMGVKKWIEQVIADAYKRRLATR